MTGGKRYTTSIVICTLNRAEALFRCIRTILAQTILPQELIIVDAGNIPSLENQIADLIHSTQIQLIYLREKPSTTRQRNIGIKTAASDILFFLDDDVLLAETYIEEILRTYASKEDDNIGGARGTLPVSGDVRLCLVV